MTFSPRVLPSRPVDSIADYEAAGGGRGLDAAVRLGPSGVIDELAASGLRGRGGAGFPTGRKWATVASSESPVELTTVVVNAAEGEPGSFKDRAIVRADPYRVLEGALIAAFTVDADEVIVAVKETFSHEVERLRRAIEEIHGADWATDIELSVFAGPPEYLYGEETALLEAIDGRGPFPRVAPPYRHGAEELGADPAPSAAQVEMASPAPDTDAPPTLVNNAETMANVPGILAQGAEWFRSVGTEESPGTIVCTITGRTQRHGVAEVPMGTPLRDVIETIGGGPEPGRRLVAALSGVSNPLLPASRFDAPVSHEGMRSVGAGLGTGGFILADVRRQGQRARSRRGREARRNRGRQRALQPRAPAPTRAAEHSGAPPRRDARPRARRRSTRRARAHRGHRRHRRRSRPARRAPAGKAARLDLRHRRFRQVAGDALRSPVDRRLELN